MAVNKNKRMNMKSYAINLLFLLPLTVISNIISRSDPSRINAFELIAVPTILSGTIGIITLFVMSVRRLHDIGKSGWWALFFLTPLTIVFIPLIALADGQSSENRYGAVPKGIRIFGIRAKGAWRIVSIVLLGVFVAYLVALYLTFIFS